MRAAGVPPEHCHPHVLRHTFATLFLRRRARDANALTKVQDLLGHASIETIHVYVHHNRDELARTMRSPGGSGIDTAQAARRQRSARRAA